MTAPQPHPEVRVLHLDDVPEMNDGRAPMRAVRYALGITTFGATASVATRAGERLINEHDESEPLSSEELYVVMRGHASFEIAGEEHDAPAGTFLRVGPGVMRTAVAGTPGTAILVIGGAAPGQVFKPTGWERFAPLLRLFATGEFESGAEQARALLIELPDSAPLLYNTACFESRAGQLELALEHLGASVRLDPSFAALAREDADFTALRERPEFVTLTAG